MPSPGDRQRNLFVYDRRYGSVRARLYVPWSAAPVWRRIGSLAEFALTGDNADGRGGERPLPARERKRLRAELVRRRRAAEADVLRAGPPAGKARRGPAGPPLREVAEAFLREQERDRRSGAETRRQLEKDVLPTLGAAALGAVTRAQLARVLAAIQARGAPIAARRTHAALRRLFNWALRRPEYEGLLAGNPAVPLDLPRENPPRARVLTLDEVRLFWRGLDAACPSPAIRAALRAILVTAQRPGEVRRAEAPEIDRGAAVWTIPAAKAKNGLVHRVPLSSLALTLFAPPPEGAWIFPGRRAGSPMGAQSLSHALADALDPARRPQIPRRAALGIAPFTPHDLRRTAASQMASLGVDPRTLARILNHAEGGVTAIYNRYGYDREKREALDAWAARLADLLGGTLHAAG